MARAVLCRPVPETRRVTLSRIEFARGRDLPQSQQTRANVEARQYKRTFTGSLHFYGLNATTTPLRARAPADHQRNAVNHQPKERDLLVPVCRKATKFAFCSSNRLPSPHTLAFSLLPPFTVCPCYSRIESVHVTPSRPFYQFAWRLRATSGPDVTEAGSSCLQPL